jgi:uncharacterized protein (TIGR02996 family)
VIAGIQRALGATDAVTAIEALLEAWRELPTSEIAAAIDRLTAAALPKEPPAWDAAVDDLLESGRLVDRLRETTDAAGRGLILQLERLRPDPRVAAAIVRLLEDPPFRATGARPFYTALFKLAARHRDPRGARALGALPARYPQLIAGVGLRDWMIAKIEGLARLLPREPRLPGDVYHALQKLGPLPVLPRAHAPVASDLLAAVYASPDDDGPRAVYADFLVQRGDPRGELIALQLGAGDAAREDELLTRHQSAWLGELAALVDKTMIAWRRGFLSWATVKLTRPKLVALRRSPMWATVERLTLLGAPPHAWRDDVVVLLETMRALRRIDGIDHGMIAWIPERVPRLDFDIPAGELDPLLGDLAANRPTLRGLGLHGRFDTREIDKVLASPLFPRLELLRVSAVGIGFVLERGEKGWRLEVDDLHSREYPVIQRLARLDDGIVELAASGYFREGLPTLRELVPTAK